MQADTSLFFSGLALGMGIAVIGGAIDYYLSRRKANLHQLSRLPGCMMYVGGALGLIGLLAIITSLILNGSAGPAIILGAGVLGGFYAGFALLMLSYLLVKRIWPDNSG